MGALIISILGLISVLILNIVVGLFLGFGKGHYWFFELMHFLGGFFVAMFFANFTSSIVMIFSALAIVTFLWELGEYILDKIPTASRFFKKTFRTDSTKYDFKDAILDIVLNFAGATAFLYLRGLFSIKLVKPLTGFL